MKAEKTLESSGVASLAATPVAPDVAGPAMQTVQTPSSDSFVRGGGCPFAKNLAAKNDDKPVRRPVAGTATALVKADVAERVEAWIQSDRFPCAGGKMAVHGRGHYQLGVYGELAGGAQISQLAADLRAFLAVQSAQWKSGNYMTSFIAAFPEAAEGSHEPRDFEKRLFAVLQALHEADEGPWPNGATKDPRDPNFHFAFGGRKFFVVGMSPTNERASRRAPVPMLAFNANHQFDDKRNPKLPKVREASRKRDEAISGDFNPNIDKVVTNMSTYSGCTNYTQRVWRAPFTFKK